MVTTPTGAKYKGLKYQKGNCGVSIVRSGEAMEQVQSQLILSVSRWWYLCANYLLTCGIIFFRV